MRASDLSVGIFASLAIHFIVAVYCLGTLLARFQGFTILPEFRHGRSSIEVNLVSLRSAPPEPQIDLSEPEEVSVVPDPEPDPEPAEEPEPQPQDQIIDEGVEQGDPEISTDIKPSYPIGARMRGEEGVVVVQIWIDAFSRAKKAEVLTSSGYPSLDRAALKALRKAHFRDGTGSPVYSQETSITFRFRLTD